MANTAITVKRFITGTTWDELYPKTTSDQVTGLSTLLNAKVSIAGDTMTGDLNMGGTKGVLGSAYVKNTSGGMIFDALNGYTFNLAANGGTIAVSGNKISGLPTPTGDTEAATKAYVDGLAAAGLHTVYQVDAAVSNSTTLAAITTALSSGGTGYLPENATGPYFTPSSDSGATDSRFLVFGHSTASENGIYYVTGSSPFYAKYTPDCEAGALVFVSDGAYNDSQYACGTDGTTWSLFSRVDTVAGTNLSRSGNTLSVVAAPDFTTQALSNNSTKAATTAFVMSQISNDAQPKHANLTSAAGLTYASTSFVKMTGANTFALDTNTYMTGLARNAVSDSVGYHLLLTNGTTTTGITSAYVDSAGDVTYNPATNTLTAGSFSGGGSGLTSLNGTNISSGTVAVARGGTGAGDAINARANLGLIQITYADTVPTSNLTAGDICFEY